jgi:hypothetical protein
MEAGATAVDEAERVTADETVARFDGAIMATEGGEVCVYT